MNTIYTETTVHIAPEAFQKEAPYQIAIVDLDPAERVTARIEGEPVRIGDPVEEAASRGGVRFFRKIK